MVMENKYLLRALQKSGYVILVKRYSRLDRSSVLEYISPNAQEVGMNQKLLQNGLKLSVDYIHPEDREHIYGAFIDAADSGIGDYLHECRLVGDDGAVHDVVYEIHISDVDENEYTAECYIRKTKAKPESRANSGHSINPREKWLPDDVNLVECDGNFGDSEESNVYKTIKIFSGSARLYSVLLDTEGNTIFPPTGPSTNLGDFYDLFEKSEYKEYYKKIKYEILENGSPMVMDREEGGIGKICLAPIRSGNKLMGFWILGSYTEEETERLKDFYLFQWEIAEMISQSLRQKEVTVGEVAKSRGVGKKLREELDRQNIIAALLTEIWGGPIKSVDALIADTIKQVSENLNIDKAFLYTIKSPYSEKNSLRSYWDAVGGGPDATILDDLPNHFNAIKKVIRENGLYIADGANLTERSKLACLRHGFKAFVCVPIYREKNIFGVLFFAECKAQRVWTKEELRFMKSVSLVISKILDETDGNDYLRRVNNQLIDSYNNFKIGVFIRDAHSGEVLFSNKAMNDMLGYDFKGRDSRNIITDLHDRFDNIDAMRKPFITKEKVTNWRRYIEDFGGIMDISEMQIDWVNGEPASLIIIRPAKEN